MNMQRYNLALIPVTYQLELIKIADQFKHGGEIDYLLGNTSLPHITLAQFYLDDITTLEKIWDNVSQLKQNKPQRLTLQLKGLNCYFDSKQNDFVWLQLLPESSIDLVSLHHEIINILKDYAITSLNKSLENYEPHLTLAHTTNLIYVDECEQYQIALTDQFYIGLGESDEIGQLTRLYKS